MRSFTYHRKAGPLRSELGSLVMIAGFELAVWFAVVPLLPRPWNWGLLALIAGLTAVILTSLFRPLRRGHRISDQTLILTYGLNGIFQAYVVRVPLGQVNRAGILPGGLPRGLSPGMRATYRPEDDTLYLVPDRVRLVELHLSTPADSRVPRQGPFQYSRLVLGLDDPAAFLEALAGESGVVPQTAGVQVQRAAPLHPAPAPAAPEGVGIQIINLQKRFGDFLAVAGLSLTVSPGEVLALLGSNGAGKTTAIRMITGLLRPTAGQVLIGGHDVWRSGSAARRLMGYVPDVPFLYDGLTARESLWLMSGLYGLSPDDGRRRAADLLEFLDLTRFGDQLIGSFSLGMKRKMAIAGALVHRPRVLLLDEVTNGLDPRASRDVKDYVAGAAREGAAIILTTHVLETAQELAHRIAVIHRGELCALGTLAQLRAQAGQPDASLEELFLALTPGVSA